MNHAFRMHGVFYLCFLLFTKGIYTSNLQYRVAETMININWIKKIGFAILKSVIA